MSWSGTVPIPNTLQSQMLDWVWIYILLYSFYVEILQAQPGAAIEGEQVGFPGPIFCVIVLTL